MRAKVVKRNQYPGKCRYCGCWVSKLDGYLRYHKVAEDGTIRTYFEVLCWDCYRTKD